jgi:SAM-dependent methyltransferase
VTKDVFGKFDRLAPAYRFHDYADPQRYFERKAKLVVELAPSLEPGDRVLDLACGDGALAGPLRRRGMGYLGVDASPAMLIAAREREPGAAFEQGLIDSYVPGEPVAATVLMRTIYLVDDVRALFTHFHAFTKKKFVFDFDPRVQDEVGIRSALTVAGFSAADFRPFLLPQRRTLPAPLQAALYVLEGSRIGRVPPRVGFPARLLVTATA